LRADPKIESEGGDQNGVQDTLSHAGQNVKRVGAIGKKQLAIAETQSVRA
jgi:hypothetical protein